MSRIPIIVALLMLAWLPMLAKGTGVTLPEARRVELDNGVVLILNVKDDVPLVGMNAVIRGGAAHDPAGKNGLAGLFAGLIERGAGERDAAQFAATVDAVGGRLEARAGLEAITISGDFLARDTALMVGLLADMLIRPTLDEDEFDKLRNRKINLLKAAKDADPGELMPSYAHAWVFGGHPYGNPVEGSESSLAAIDHDDIVDYYASGIGSDRLIVSISGDIDVNRVEAMLTDAFGDWRAPESELAPIETPPVAAGGRVLLVDKPGATQTYFWIGNRGVAIDYNGRAELDIANTLFGGRFTSMLNQALRIDSGLSYGARSTVVRPSQPGSVAITSFTATPTTTEAIDLALSVLRRLKTEPFDEAALASAKNYLLGLFPMRLETADQIARQFATLETYGLRRRYIDGYADAVESVTIASAAGVVAEVYPDPDELVFVLIGDATAIRDAAAAYGTVTELPIAAPTFRVPEPVAPADPQTN